MCDIDLKDSLVCRLLVSNYIFFPKTIICKDILYQVMRERNHSNVICVMLALPLNIICNNMLHQFMKIKKTFMCEICSISFARKTNLKEHIESVHEGKKPFKRDIFDAFFE